jgi:DNA-binding PadR family transcriptional regulator
LTGTQAAVLGLLTVGERSGYDLRKAAERSVGYLWKPAKSQIYAILPMLVEEGYATRRDVAQEARPDKQLYRITAKGERALRDWLEHAEIEPQTWRDAFMLKVFFGEHLPHDSLVALVEQHRQKLVDHRDRLLEIESDAKSEDDGSDFFPLLTLRSGVLHTRAAIRWCDETLRALEERR